MNIFILFIIFVLFSRENARVFKLKDGIDQFFFENFPGIWRLIHRGVSAHTMDVVKDIFSKEGESQINAVSQLFCHSVPPSIHREAYTL
jgi:hypothetical protein